ncbi:hypothetical protein TNCV_575391 [Trichonephila clavipes]|nr:hypothetical protein TNCV_575391 [Trichonephila clavipes]
MIAKIHQQDHQVANIVTKNDANFALSPRFRRFHRIAIIHQQDHQVANIVTKNDANFALSPRFRRFHRIAIMIRIQSVPNSPKMIANMTTKSPKITPTWLYRLVPIESPL